VASSKLLDPWVFPKIHTPARRALSCDCRKISRTPYYTSPSFTRTHTSNQQQPQGITFREANFNSPTTLDTAFRDVTKLLIVSTDTLDVALRTQQQRYAIDAAKRQGVERIYYTSLAFGGFSDDSKVGLMAAHLATEAYLKAFVPPRTMREDVYLTESE